MRCNFTLQPLSEKTAHSSPGAPRKTTKGRKRRQKVVDVVKSNENEAAEDEDKGNRLGRRSQCSNVFPQANSQDLDLGSGFLVTNHLSMVKQMSDNFRKLKIGASFNLRISIFLFIILIFILLHKR